MHFVTKRVKWCENECARCSEAFVTALLNSAFTRRQGTASDNIHHLSLKGSPSLVSDGHVIVCEWGWAERLTVRAICRAVLWISAAGSTEDTLPSLLWPTLTRNTTGGLKAPGSGPLQTRLFADGLQWKKSSFLRDNLNSRAQGRTGAHRIGPAWVECVADGTWGGYSQIFLFELGGTKGSLYVTGAALNRGLLLLPPRIEQIHQIGLIYLWFL